MKRQIAALAGTAALALTLAACGGNADTQTQATTTVVATQTVAAEPTFTPGAHNQGSQDPAVLKAMFPALKYEGDKAINSLANRLCKMVDIDPKLVGQEAPNIADQFDVTYADASAIAMSALVVYCPKAAGL